MGNDAHTREIRFRPWVTWTATAPFRAVAWCWRAGGIRGRLTAGIALSVLFTFGYALTDPGISSGSRRGAIIAGAVSIALFAGALEFVQVRDRRRWRERGPKVIAGGLERYFPELASPDLSAAVVKANRQRIAELEADVASLKISKTEFEAKLRDLFVVMAEAAEAAGVPTPDSDETQPIRRLYVVPNEPSGRAGTA